jgi:hypothetical protein
MLGESTVGGQHYGEKGGGLVENSSYSVNDRGRQSGGGRGAW